MAELAAYDGVETGELAARLGVPRMVAYDSIGSTMDAAHDLARAGTVDRTLVLADEQSLGRGRERREWRSVPGGVWITLIARELDAGNLGVAPLRTGLAAAQALDALAGEHVSLKWPNDLYLSAGKLGGILVEARWRGDVFDWAAIGVGINRIPPAGMEAAGLGAAVTRSAVLERVVPAMLSALSRSGPLTGRELAALAARDLARGRMISQPVRGLVTGLSAEGALLVEIDGRTEQIRSGSLVFTDSPQSLTANR